MNRFSQGWDLLFGLSCDWLVFWEQSLASDSLFFLVIERGKPKKPGEKNEFKIFSSMPTLKKSVSLFSK